MSRFHGVGVIRFDIDICIHMYVRMAMLRTSAKSRGYRVEGTRNVQGPPAEASASFSGRTSCLGICGRGRSRYKGRQQ